MKDYYNPGDDSKTLVDKDFINKNEYVKVVKQFNGKVLVKTTDNREEWFELKELQPLGVHKYSRNLIEITNEKNYEIIGNMHLTKNVRLADYYGRLGDDVFYANLTDDVLFYGYKYREISDEEAVEILLDEVLYGINPKLCSSSCVGNVVKGIDSDTNYHDGYYILPNNEVYTMTYCGNRVIIRKGMDGGWYHDKENAGPTIYKGETDWVRIKNALIKQEALNILTNPAKVKKYYSNLIDIVAEDVKGNDKFKLMDEIYDPRLSNEEVYLLAYIERFTDKQIAIDFKDDYIRYTWQQFGSEGETCKEGERIKILKKEITKILGDRLMEFYYGNDKQSVYFKKNIKDECIKY